MAALVDRGEAESLQLGGEESLVGTDPLPAGVDPQAGHLRDVLGQCSAADAITRLEDHDLLSRCDQPVRSDESGHTGTDDDGLNLHDTTLVG